MYRTRPTKILYFLTIILLLNFAKLLLIIVMYKKFTESEQKITEAFGV